MQLLHWIKYTLHAQRLFDQNLPEMMHFYYILKKEFWIIIE